MYAKFYKAVTDAQPHQFFYFQSIQCESVDAIKGNKLQCNASLVERVAVSRDYRSVDYPDIGFAHFPLARPLYICIPKYLEEKFTHHRQSFLDQQTKGYRYGGICKTNKTKGLVYRSYGSTSLFLSANLSILSLLLSFSAFSLFFSLFQTGRTSKCAVDRSAAELKRGSDKGLSLGVTVETSGRDAGEKEKEERTGERVAKAAQ